MFTASNHFDPILLLPDSDKEQLSENSIQKLRKSLILKMWDYLTIKMAHDFTEKQLDEVLDAVSIEQRKKILKKYTQDFDKKVDQYIEEFKKDFKEQD